MPSNHTRGDSSAQGQPSLRAVLTHFPTPPGVPGVTVATGLGAPPSLAAPVAAAGGEGARAAPAAAAGPLASGTPQEHLRLMAGGLCGLPLAGPRPRGLAAADLPLRRGGKASSVGTTSSQSSASGWKPEVEAASASSTDYAGSSSSRACSLAGKAGPEAAGPREGAPEGLSSLGASLHRRGECTPCKFIRSLRGCRDGSMCMLCHEPHEELSRSAVRKAARTKGLLRRSMIERAEVRGRRRRR
ncbi:unnamed protein product, partial [Prorocentrum cordatum]